MNANELLEHEIIKRVLKLSVMNNVSLSSYQKQFFFDNIDQAAQRADWIVNMVKQFGYYR